MSGRDIEVAPGLTKGTFAARLWRGWSIEKAMTEPVRKSFATIEEYFAAKCRPVDSGCIEWVSKAYTQGGYGMLKVNGRSKPAHRYAYEAAHGELPSHLDVCHECDNPKCVNVKHLFPGTRQQNMDNAVAKGRMSRTPKVWGEAHPSTHLSERDVLAIRELRSQGNTLVSIAPIYGISLTAVSRIALHKTWKHVTHV